jgi:ParB family chromosome partitioning protein
MYREIETERLYPHPRNPRRDLGDLAELAESIKSTGILQNLTVVTKTPGPGHCCACKLYLAGPAKCKDGHDDGSIRPPCPEWQSNGEYTVVIGHRRLAAAKLAGLETVPCIVSDMDEKEQIATMLAENVQRSDLTYLEQADGIQTMLDLGETISGVSGRTGFSETTVRRRVCLLSHDRQEVEKAFERGATLLDFAEIQAIENPEDRADLFAALGRPGFSYCLQSAKERRELAPHRAEMEETLKSFASEVSAQPPGTRYVRYLAVSADAVVPVPEDAGTGKYYFRSSRDGFYLYADLFEQGSDAFESFEREAERNRAEREKRRAKAKIAFDARIGFLKGMTEAGCKKAAGKIAAFAALVYSGDLRVSWDFEPDFEILCGLLDVDPGEDDEEETVGKGDLVRGLTEAGQPHRALLFAICSSVDPDLSDPEALGRLYGFFSSIGYGMSDEERSLCEIPEPARTEP